MTRDGLTLWVLAWVIFGSVAFTHGCAAQTGGCGG